RGSLNTMSAGAIPAGNITVAAGTIGISEVGSGIYSTTPVGATASAGNIDVLVTQDLSIVNGGEINSSTFGKGNAGSVKVSAGGITIDSKGKTQLPTGIYSNAFSDSSGNAGTIEVTATGNLSVLNGGEINSSTFAKGNAGSLKVSAGSI